MNAFINWLLGIFGGKPAPAPDTTDPCNAAACVNAKQRLATARGNFNGICTGLKVLRSITDVLNTILSTPRSILIALLAAIVVGALIGGAVGGAISLFAVAVLAVWAVSWLLLPVVERIVVAFGQALVKALQEVQAAVPDVIANCPERCRGDVSIPQCNVG